MSDTHGPIAARGLRAAAGRGSRLAAWLGLALVLPLPAAAQSPAIRSGDPVPRDVREIYEGGCRWLAKTQDASGSWKGSNEGSGVTGMAMMVLLASGEDPNHGAYRTNIRRALRSMIRAQDVDTGFYGGAGHTSMYQHGFAMLAMAEAYGAVDDRGLWTEEGGDGKGLSTGESLELAVKLAVQSARKNPLGAWRYSPDATDQDTSVSGAILMGLLGARNAGIEVPDETIDKALDYFATMTGPEGTVGYSGGPGGGSEATTAIGTLVMAIARRKDLPKYALAAGASRTFAAQESGGGGHLTYSRYYQAQALFQSDVDVWKEWNERLVRKIKAERRPDGSLVASTGENDVADVCLSLLSLAVNFRFLPIYER